MSNQIYRPPSYQQGLWKLSQIYTTPELAFGVHSGGVVPNVNDIVIDWAAGVKIEYYVESVDPITNVSVLKPVENVVTGDGSVVGKPTGVGGISNVANLYFNPMDSKLPASIDARLPIYGHELSFVRIFLGTDISATGKVVSVNLDEVGTLIDDKVAVIKADMVDSTLRWVTRPFNLIQYLDENTLLTAVFYSDNGIEIIQELIVKHNHLVANVNSNNTFIRDLFLESVYQNPLDKSELLIPQNLLGEAFAPRIYKQYQNGAKEELFVGSSNVSLFGWGSHLTGEVGERFEIVLNYYLQAGELSDIVDRATGKHISKIYRVKVVESGNDTDVKVFMVPEWDIVNGNTLSFYLYTEDRSVLMNVTEHIALADPNMDLSVYGVKRSVSFSLDLSLIPAVNSTEVYADTIDLMFLGIPMGAVTWYRLWYYRDDIRYYGDLLRVKAFTSFGTRLLSMDNGYTVFGDWLENMFYKVEPIKHELADPLLITPTNIDLDVNGTIIPIDIATYWNGSVDISAIDFTNIKHVKVFWYKINDLGERLDLAVTSLPIEFI